MVNRLVAVVANELVRPVVAERGDGRGIGEPDRPLGIHDPDWLCHRVEHGGEEVLRADRPATEIGQGGRHALVRA
jgi:hypothetical protein